MTKLIDIKAVEGCFCSKTKRKAEGKKALTPMEDMVAFVPAEAFFGKLELCASNLP